MYSAHTFDIIGELDRAGVGYLAEQILLNLDGIDLFQAFQVCRLWRSWDSISFWRRKLKLIMREARKDFWWCPSVGMTGRTNETGKDIQPCREKYVCTRLWSLDHRWQAGDACNQSLQMESSVLCLTLERLPCPRSDIWRLFIGLNNGSVQDWAIDSNSDGHTLLQDKEIHNKGVRVVKWVSLSSHAQSVTDHCQLFVTGDKSCVSCPGTNFLITGSYDGRLKVLDVDNQLMVLAEVSLGLPLTDIETVLTHPLQEMDIYSCGDEGLIVKLNLSYDSISHKTALKSSWVIHGSSDSTKKEVSLMVNALSVNSQREIIVTGNDEGNLLVRSMKDGIVIQDLEGHQRGCGITALVEDCDGYLWSASFDCTIRMWDLSEYTCKAILSGHNDPVRSLSVDSRRLVSGDYRGFVMIWEKRHIWRDIRQEEKENLKKKRSDQIDGIFMMRRGRVVQQKIGGVAEVVQHKSFLEHRSHVTALDLSVGLLVSGSRDRTVCIYQFHKKKEQTRRRYI